MFSFHQKKKKKQFSLQKQNRGGGDLRVGGRARLGIFCIEAVHASQTFIF
jgi:hypothetical protein